MKVNNKLLIGLVVLLGFIVIAQNTSSFIIALSPHNRTDETQQLEKEINSQKKSIIELERQYLNLNMAYLQSDENFRSFKKSIVEDYSKIKIDTSEVTEFFNLKSQFDIYKNKVEIELNEIRNIKYSLDEFVKNYPQGQFYADRITALERSIESQNTSIEKRDDELRKNIESRLEQWGKSFDLYSLILSVIATALIGLIGVVFIYIRKIEK